MIHPSLEKKIEEKTEKRARKKRVKMIVDGGDVKKLRKIIANKILIMLIFLGVFISGPVLASEIIDNFAVNIDINQDSSLTVREVINYNFGQEQRRGIFRTVPFAYQNSKGNFNVILKDFTVTDFSGESYKFETIKEGDGLRIKIGDPEQYVTGNKVYVISYKVERAINFFDDHDELYWNAIGNKWTVPIKQSKAVVKFPESVSSSKSKFECFVGLPGSTKQCVSKKGDFVSDSQLLSMTYANDQLNPGEGFTIVAGIPKGVVKKTLWRSWFWFLSDNLFAITPVIVFMVMYILWRRQGRDARGAGTIIPQYDVPDSLTPSQVGTLLDERVDQKDVSSEIISLATKGFLKIHQIKEGILFKTNDYLIEKLPDTNQDLLQDHEQELLSGLFSDKNKIASFNSLKKAFSGSSIEKDGAAYKIVSGILSGLEKIEDRSELEKNENVVRLSDLRNSFYEDYKKIEDKVYDSLVTGGYFPSSPKKVRLLYTIGSIMAVTLFFIGLNIVFAGIVFSSITGFIGLFISLVIVIIFSIRMPAKTEKGVVAREHILGLKIYLSVAEADRLDFHNAPERNPEHFEKLLPYAMVLGVEKKWAKQFEDIYQQNSGWYTGVDHLGAMALASDLNSFKTQANSTITSTASSGGSGFSGGGVGGGGGGGGGGSW